MRKIIIIAAAVLLAACGSQPTEQTRRDIEAAAYGYLDAMGNYRPNDAAPYATRLTCERSIPILAILTEKCDTAYIRSNTPADIEIKGVRMLSDTSAYAYYHKHTPITEQEDSLLMLLEEGRWLAEVRLGPIPAMLLAPSPEDK